MRNRTLKYPLSILSGRDREQKARVSANGWHRSLWSNKSDGHVYMKTTSTWERFPLSPDVNKIFL